MNERETRLLHAYHDGELGAWSRRRLEARLRGSPELRLELALLQDVGEAARAADVQRAEPDLWSDIRAGLASIDAEVAPRRRRVESSQLWGRFPARSWGALPLGAAALAASALLAMIVIGRLPASVPEIAAGTVRFLDTDGRAVLVLEESDDVTIIWLVDGV